MSSKDWAKLCVNGWVKTDVALPPEGVYVLCHLTLDNYGDRDDSDGVYYVVAKCAKGITQKEREDLSADNPRKSTYCFEDECVWSNNHKAYAFKMFGQCCYAGQDVDYWQFIDRLSK